MSDSNEPLEITIKGDNNNSNLILNSEQSVIGDAATKKEQSNIDYLKNYFKEVNYDLEKVKQLIYDAPDFESGLKLLLDVVSVWNNTSEPLKITHYNTPIFEVKYLDSLGNPDIDFSNIDEELKSAVVSLLAPINSSIGHLSNVSESNSLFILILGNSISKEGGFIQMTIDNIGRIINIAPDLIFKIRDNITGELKNIQKGIHQVYYNSDSIPEGGLPITDLPEKLRTSIINHPPGSLPDPLITKDATIAITQTPVEFPGSSNARNMIYQTNDLFLFLSLFMTDLSIDSNKLVLNDNILQTNIEPSSIPPFRTKLNIEDFKKEVNYYRALFDFPLIEW